MFQEGAPLSAPSVIVKDTGTGKGRGVFALRPFREGELVEECPTVPLLTPYEKLPEELQKIVFHWEDRKGLPAMQALALGYGSLYNHNNPANMRYEVDLEARVFRFVAVRHISAGAELTVNYNAVDRGPLSDDDWWFKENMIEPIISQ